MSETKRIADGFFVEVPGRQLQALMRLKAARYGEHGIVAARESLEALAAWVVLDMAYRLSATEFLSLAGPVPNCDRDLTGTAVVATRPS